MYTFLGTFLYSVLMIQRHVQYSKTNMYVLYKSVEVAMYDKLITFIYQRSVNILINLALGGFCASVCSFRDKSSRPKRKINHDLMNSRQKIQLPWKSFFSLHNPKFLLKIYLVLC